TRSWRGRTPPGSPWPGGGAGRSAPPATRPASVRPGRSHPARRAVLRARGSGRSSSRSPPARRPDGLRDLVLFDQAQLVGSAQAEMAAEEGRDPLHVELPVGEVGAGVGRALDDPDLPRTAVTVIEQP